MRAKLSRFQQTWTDYWRYKLPAWGRIACTVALGLLVVGVIAVVVVGLAPQWLADTAGLTDKQQAEEQGRVRTGLLAVLAGSVAIVGAIYTARSYELSREAHRLDEEKHVAERLTRAVEQLGREDADHVRLGGIYALERIGRSKEDAPTVVEVLAAYVRHHAVWSDKGSDEKARRLRKDIEAAVDIVSRLRSANDRLDLSGLDLRRLNLSWGAGLEGATLAGVHLEDADLTEIELVGADLRNAHLERARFDSARFFADATPLEDDLDPDKDGNIVWVLSEPANLAGAHLEDAVLSRADLRLVDLSRATATGAKLAGANLAGANLTGADLTGAEMDHATSLDGVVYDDETVWPAGSGIPTGWRGQTIDDQESGLRKLVRDAE